MFQKKKNIVRYRPKRIIRTKQIQSKKIKNLIRQRSNPNKSPRKLYKWLLLILLIAIIYLLLFSGVFKIKDIISINNTDETQILSQKIYENISDSIGKNILFIKTDKLKEKILNVFPELEEIRITKKYPSTLKFEFSKFPITANVITEHNNIKKTYIINSMGYAIKEDFENPNLPYIHIKSEDPVNTGKPVIESNKLQYILESKTYFEEKFGMQVLKIDYKPIPREIHLFTEKNFYIWIDIQRSYEEQFKKLKKALVKLDIYNENLLYIDLRIPSSNGDKIFYKRK